MSTPEQQVVDRMYAAFQSQDLAAAVATVSADSLWIHHGTQKLPAQRFQGQSGVRQFFSFFFTSMRSEYFRRLRTLQDGNTVIVIGEEKFRIDGNPEALAQRWVQIYSLEQGLITRMEEFATSVDPSDYQVVS